MDSENISKREEINDFILRRNIKNSMENNVLSLKNNYVDIIKVEYDSGCVKYNFRYVGELELLDETIYVYTKNLKLYLDIFSNNISMDNAIDQNLNIDFSMRNIKFEFNNKQIKFYKKIHPHRYSNDKKEKVLGKLNYYNSINELNNKSSCTNTLIDFDDFISKNIEYIIDDEKYYDKANRKRESILQKNIIKYLLDSEDIPAQITSINVEDNGNIILHIEADNIIHEKDMTYTFENPMEEKSKFLKFIDYIDIKSLDELELQPIKLSRKPDVIVLKVNHWHITKLSEHENKQENKGIINNIISIIH